MAGKLKPDEVKKLMGALTEVNRKLGSCLESLEENQKMLEKSVRCQAYMNHYQINTDGSGEMGIENVFLNRLLDEALQGKGKLFATKDYIEGLLPENCGHINKPGTPRKLESLKPIQTAFALKKNTGGLDTAPI